MTALLLDSAAYIDLMRAGCDVRQLLLPSVRAGRLYNCGVVRAEVLRGMRAPEVRAGMTDFFDIVPEVPTDAKLWREVTDLGWQLARAGKWPPVSDLTIAACAMRARALLISPDAHFKDVPGLKLATKLPE